MKASDLEEVTDLLKDLKVLDFLAENDYSWFVDFHLVGNERPKPPHPMHRLWNDMKAEVDGVVKGRMLSKIRLIRIQLSQLGVEVNEKEEE